MSQLQLPPPYHHILTALCGRDLPLAFEHYQTAHPVTRPRFGHHPLTLETCESWTIAAAPLIFTSTTCVTLPASTDEIRYSPLCCWPSTTRSNRSVVPHKSDTSRFYPYSKRYQRRYQGGTERYQQAVPGDTRRYRHPEKAIPSQYRPVRQYRPGITFSPVPPRRYPVLSSKQGDTGAIRAVSTARIGIASLISTPLPANAAQSANHPDPARCDQLLAPRSDGASGETRRGEPLRLCLLPVTARGKDHNQEERLPDYLRT